jgi:hypothetical protein
MKAMLLLALSLPLLADTVSLGPAVFNTSQQASGSGATASAYAEVDPFSNLPVATVLLSSWCNAFDQCTEASGSASFSIEMDIVTTSGLPGMIELYAAQDATAIWGRSGFSVSLPNVGIGPHGMPEYEFYSGEQFTIAGSVSGSCSECDGGGWIRLFPYYVTDVPEPGSAALVLTGLAVLLWRRLCGV